MNASQAAYLFQPDKNYVEYDLGDRSIQCGRKADAYKLWLAWKAKGDLGWRAEVEHVHALGKALERHITSNQSADDESLPYKGLFLMAAPRSCTNVCFWYIPPRLAKEVKLHVVTADESTGEPASPVSLVGVPE